MTSLHEASIAATMSGGDMLASFGGYPGVLMGAESTPAFSLSGSLPVGPTAGRISGWVQGLVSASSCAFNATIASATVRLES